MRREAYKKLIFRWQTAGFLTVVLTEWGISSWFFASLRAGKTELIDWMIVWVLIIRMARLMVHIVVPIYSLQVLFYLVRICRFSGMLKKYDTSANGKLEDEYRMGDHEGDLYFTRSCLIVHQLGRVWKKQSGFAVIPYHEIVGIRTKKGRDNEKILVIDRNGSDKFHYVYFTDGVTDEAVRRIQNKVELFCQGLGYLRTMEEEQKKQEKKAEKKAAVNRVLAAPEIPIFVTFGMFFVYCLYSSYVASLDGKLNEWLKQSLPVSAGLMFWPNFVFVVMSSLTPIFLVVYPIWNMARYKKYDKEKGMRLKRVKSVIYSVMMAGFIMFMAMFGGHGIHAADLMKEGKKYLRDGYTYSDQAESMKLPETLEESFMDRRECVST